ncbi:tyrosine-type recombinase/integrase [Iamia majanohamensis]|uniref:Tyrosine-type recombinase/integrase n=1 Tax=Iamia majanohamensis TaxID=467976 RepID=A0AAF0BTV0_9ACTN|nr:tyrosine-type recombinase/integrase [Iamia majanohamensis]WCO65290.1 tyrosine-type recombinase/integrase [Iamia majanohamensis]
MRGGLRERSPGVWEVRVEAGRDPVTGRRRQVSRTVRGGKRDAQKVLNRLAAETDTGANVGTSATFDDLAGRWLTLCERDLSPTTVHRYRILLRNHIAPALGSVAVHRIQPVQLDALYGGLMVDKGLSPATVRQVHAIIRRALQQAVRWGWIATNPAANATPPRVPKPDVAPPDVEQVAALLAAATDASPEFGRFLHLAAATGARRGELCALRWRDVDAENSAVVISRAIVEVGQRLTEKDTKTHAARRIALDPGTLAVLVAQRAEVDDRAAQADATLGPEAFVFSREPDGSAPWAPGYVTGQFQRLRKSVGLPQVRLHDLRYFAATRLIAAGVPVRTVSGRLGHANAATTLTVYAHFLEASDQAAADVVGSLLPTTG